MNKTWLLLMILLFIPVAIAAPPSPVFQSSVSNSAELDVIFPKVEFIKQRVPFNFHVHAYNSTGALLTNETTECHLHIYNNTGNHILNEEMSFDSNLQDYQTILNSSLTAEKGLLPFVAWCNNTIQGGFVSGSLTITDFSGVRLSEDTTQGLSISLFILFSTLLFFALPKLIKDYTENKMFKLIFGRCCYVIGFYLMAMNSAIIASLASYAGYATAELYRYMWLFGTAGYLMIVFTAMKTLLDIVALYKWNKKEKRGTPHE